MGKTYPHIDDKLAEWIKAQKMFFVATAPLAADGHINCSPKGGTDLKVLDPLTVVYQDLTGSGIETIAHIKENSRIVIMFCAFEGPPKILRLYGHGEVITSSHTDYDSLKLFFSQKPGIRALVRVKLSRIGDSCGMSVPYYDFKENRDALDLWADSKGEAALEEYRRQKNALSIDRLPGLGDGR